MGFNNGEIDSVGDSVSSKPGGRNFSTSKVVGLMTWVTITSSTMGILSPLLVTHFESEYFVVAATAIEFFVLFGIMFFTLVRDYKESLIWKHIIWLGIFNAYMAMSLLYASHPERTPPVMQSTLTGLAIIPSAIFRKLSFPDAPNYDMRFIGLSCLFLAGSLVAAAIPIADNNKHASYWWSLIYLSGVCARSYYNIIQEKYVRETEYTPGSPMNDREKLENRIRLSFYSRIIMIMVIIPAFGLEWIDNKDYEPFTKFDHSFHEAFTNLSHGGMLQGFIICYFFLFFSAIYLNAISTNYHMILTAICNPMVALFFTIFPDLNPGLHYPLWSVVASLGLSFVSVFLWMKGNKGHEDNKSHIYTSVDVEANNTSTPYQEF